MPNDGGGALSGNINLPIAGSVKKEYVLIGGAVFGLLLYVFIRQRRKAQQAAATAAAGANTGIDPATGYPYGSAEDAAALANQGSYINPSQPFAPGGGGSGGGYPTPGSGPGSFTNNAQWAQYAEDYLYNHGQMSDVAPLSAAIGKYLAGRSTSGDEQSLVEQAIAVAGYPPTAGPDGKPPGFNTAPPGNTQPPSGGGAKLPPPTGLFGGSGMFNRVNGRLVNNYIDWGWNAVPGAAHYHWQERSAFGSQSGDVTTPGIHETGLMAPNADHYLTVWAVDSAGNLGESATTVTHTHDNSY